MVSQDTASFHQIVSIWISTAHFLYTCFKFLWDWESAKEREERLEKLEKKVEELERRVKELEGKVKKLE